VVVAQNAECSDMQCNAVIAVCHVLSSDAVGTGTDSLRNFGYSNDCEAYTNRTSSKNSHAATATNWSGACMRIARLVLLLSF
jgi:hypothetical protein